MLEAQPVAQVTEETKNEIPFGIRAIQSGIEVDGVWISRTNTPVGSSRASLYSEKIPRAGLNNNNNNNNSQLELPQPVAQGSSRNSSCAPSSFDRAVSAEPLSNSDSRSSSPATATATAHGQLQAQEAPRCSNCHHSVSPTAVSTNPSPCKPQPT